MGGRDRRGGDVPVPLRRFGIQHSIGIIYLIVVPLLITVILILAFVNLRQQHNREVRQVARNRQQIRVLQRGLVESCHATTSQIGVITALILYLSSSPNASGYQAQKAISDLAGFASDLSSLTACQQITRP
jgi:uncharacterized membrane protein